MDSTLRTELLGILDGTDWSVDPQAFVLEPASESPADLVALDASHPEAGTWRHRLHPGFLEVLSIDAAEEATSPAEDIIVRGAPAAEWRLRLQRLQAGRSRETLRRRYVEAFASMATGIVVVGPELQMVFANPHAYELVGHREETIGEGDIEAVIAPSDWTRLREALGAREYRHAMDLQLMRRDGTMILCSASLAPMHGSEDHMVITFDDVTEERATEAELLKTMQFLESLIDASVDAIVATDVAQRVVLFNPSAEQLTGRHHAETVGTLSLDDLLGKASAQLVTQRLLTDEHGGKGRLEPTTLELVDIHETRIPVQLSASMVYEGGTPSAIVLIMSDLRDRIRVEERLAEAQKKLAFNEKHGVLAELAGTAAHELNQPLTSMMAYAELLLRQSPPGSSGAKTASVLVREAERMAEIVRKIGKITRYETTSYVGQQKIFDLDRAADTPTPKRGSEG